MSRVGGKPIPLPKGVEVSIQNSQIRVKGPKGQLVWKVPSCCKVDVNQEQVAVARLKEDKQSRAMHGTARSLLSNMVKGVSEGYQKELKIVGMGYRARLEGKKLVLSVGFSHPVQYTPPEGIDVQIPDATTIKVIGCDKQKVGEVAAEIRSIRKPEPYKGKGIRYADEQVKLKVGKAGLGAKG